MLPSINDPKLQASYQAEHEAILLKRTRIALIIALVFVPAGILLDYFIYPTHLYSFLSLRSALEAGTFALLVVLRYPIGRRYTIGIGFVHGYAAIITFLAMIFIADGPQSPYYGGLIIYFVGIALIMPWTAQQTTLFWLPSLLVYVLICTIHTTGTTTTRFDLLLANSFFIFVISVMSSTSSHLTLLGRINDFLLRHEIAKRNRQLEQTLKQLKETESILVQSEKMNALGNLSAGLLHEINNPLNVAIAAVAYANDIIPDDSPEMQETLQDVKICMDRINKIVSDLHTFAHPVKDYENTPFNMEEAVESALSLGAHALDQIKIVKNLNGSLRPLGSKQQIVHVILNFLLNAAVSIEKKDSKNKGLIEVTSRTEDNRVYLSIRDNGKGIPPDLLDKIFDPFFTTSQVGESMGLGLSISHTIVKNHGGRINVNSKTGEGAEFSFDLAAESRTRGQ